MARLFAQFSRLELQTIGLVFIISYVISLMNYLFFHTIAELFTIIINGTIFLVTWHIQDRLPSNYLKFLGTSLLFVSFIDLLHTLSYKGMGIFPGYDSNLPTQLWILARYLQALSLILAAYYHKKGFKPLQTFTIYFAVTFFGAFAVFQGYFPDCYIEGSGLTTFKIFSEYAINLLQVASLYLLINLKTSMDEDALWLKGTFIVASIFAELFFTFYINVYGASNFLGHIIRVFGYYALYKAVMLRGIEAPYFHLYNNLLQNQKTLADSEGRFRGTFEQAAVGIAHVDPTGRWLLVNKGLSEIVGYTPEELRNLTFQGITHPDDLEADLVYVNQMLRREIDHYSMEKRYIKKDGSIAWVNLTVSAIYDEEGNVKQFISIIQDISNRKRLEQELVYGNLLLYTIEDTSNEGIMIIDEPGNITYNNETFKSMWKLSEDVQPNILDASFRQLFIDKLKNPEIFHERIDYLNKNKEEKSSDIFELKDGKIISSYSSPLIDSNGVNHGRAWFFRNITEGVMYQRKLEAINRYMSKLSEAETMQEIGDEAIRTITQVLNYDYVSFRTLSGDKLTLVSHSRKGGVDPAPDLSLDGPGVTVRAVKTGVTQVVKDTRLDPDYVPMVSENLSELAVPVWKNNDVVGVINVESSELDAFSENEVNIVEIIAINVASELARLEYTDTLEEKNQELETLNTMKDRFISTATHELRTPVTAIQGFVEILTQGYGGQLTQETREFMGIIERNTHRLVNLVNDLLDVQRIVLGKIKIDRVPVRIDETVKNIVDEMKPIFNKRLQSVHLDIDEALVVDADENRISQVVLNLLSNASKFTDENGDIYVRVKRDGDFAQVDVTDTGIGLAEEDLSKLFRPFPDIVKPNHFESTGLGLSICKGIVELHGGNIWAESEGPNKGSTFKFTLPLKDK